MEDSVLSILYLSLLNSLLTSEGYPLVGYKGSVVRFTNHRQRISPKQFYSILDQSLASPQTAGLGFQYGKLLDMSAAGTVGQLFMSCSTIEHAFEEFLSFYPLLSLSMQLDVCKEKSHSTAFIDRLYDDTLPKHVQWFLTEALLTCMITQSRWLTGKNLSFAKVKIAYPRPSHYRLYQSTFGCEVEFDCGRHSVQADQAMLGTPILTANNAVYEIKKSHCHEVLRHWESLFSIREQIYTLLKRTHPHIPSMELAAKKLHLSRSSLYRKLRVAETNYQRIVDDFRRDEAVEYLQHSKLTLCDIAENLGFSDASNFRRAFKKWTGVSPRNYRDALRSATPNVVGKSM
jgi:AraC-like DNA-binding protein